MSEVTLKQKLVEIGLVDNMLAIMVLSDEQFNADEILRRIRYKYKIKCATCLRYC